MTFRKGATKPYIAEINFKDEYDGTMSFEDMCDLVGDYAEDNPADSGWYVATDGTGKPWPYVCTMTATAVVHVPSKDGNYCNIVDIDAILGGIALGYGTDDEEYVAEIKDDLETQVRDTFTRLTGQEA